MLKVIYISLLSVIILLFLTGIFFNILECVEKIRDFVHFKKMKGHYVIRWIHRDTDGKYRYMSYVSEIRKTGVSGGKLKNALIFKNAQDALTEVLKHKYDSDFVIIKI